MKKLTLTKNDIFLILFFFIANPPIFAQDAGNFNNGIELSMGYNYMIYQSGYGLISSTGAEITVSKSLVGTIRGEAGFRLGMKPLVPEGFIRGIAFQVYGRWRPSIGIETGITNRAVFESSSNLLKEPREVMLKDMGHCYVSTHIELLSFRLKNDLRISLLELDIGTHYKHPGRTLRAQTVIIRLGKFF